MFQECTPLRTGRAHRVCFFCHCNPFFGGSSGSNVLLSMRARVARSPKQKRGHAFDLPRGEEGPGRAPLAGAVRFTPG